MEHFPEDDTPPRESDSQGGEILKPDFERIDSDDETRSIILLARLMGANIEQVLAALKECSSDIENQELAAGLALLAKRDLDSRIRRFGTSDAYFSSLKQRGIPDDVRVRFEPLIRAFLVRTAPNEYWKCDREMRAVAIYLLSEARETAYTACAVLNRIMGTTMKYGTVDQQIRRRVERMTAQHEDDPATYDERARAELAAELRKGYAWDDPLTDEELARGSEKAAPILREVRAISDTDPDSWRRSAVARAFVLAMKHTHASGLEIAHGLHYGMGFPLWSPDTFEKTDTSKLPATFSETEAAEAERLARYAREAHRIAMRVQNMPRPARRALTERTWLGVNRMRERAKQFPQFQQLSEAIARRGRMAQLMRLDYLTVRPGGTGDAQHELVITLEPPTAHVGHSKDTILRYWEFVAAVKQDLLDAQDGLVSILRPALSVDPRIARVYVKQHKWTPNRAGADDRFAATMPLD